MYLLFFSFLLCGDLPQNGNSSEENKQKILFVVSNADHYGFSDIATANHFAEIVYPYDILKQNGYTIDFVSPIGGPIPLGYFDTSDTLIRNYLYDCDFMKLLADTQSPQQIDPNEYGAIYYSGGGAAMFGIANNPSIQNIAMTIYEQNNGVISAVCHGSIGLANLKSTDGSYLVDGKNINGFPDLFENKNAAYFKEFEHSVEELLLLRGADFKYSKEGWDGFYQVSDRIITGQDPSSAIKVAQLIIDFLNK